MYFLILMLMGGTLTKECVMTGNIVIDPVAFDVSEPPHILHVQST